MNMIKMYSSSKCDRRGGSDLCEEARDARFFHGEGEVGNEYGAVVVAFNLLLRRGLTRARSVRRWCFELGLCDRVQRSTGRHRFRRG